MLMEKMTDLKKILLSDTIAYILIFLIFCGFFSHSNFSLLKIIPSILLVITYGLRYLLKNEVTKKSHKPFFQYFLWCFIFLLYSGISLFWTIDKTYTLQLLKDMFYTFFFILVVLFYITDLEKSKKIMSLFVLTCVYTSMLILIFNWQLIGSDAFGSITGLYFNRLALLLCNGIFFSLYLYLKNHQSRYILTSILFYFIIYLTGSRKSLVMPLIFICLFLMLGIGKDKKKFKQAITIIIGVLAVSILVISVNSSLRERMIDLVQSLFNPGIVTDGSIRERAYFRETAIDLFMKKPITGVGLNGFRAYLNLISYRHVTYSHCNYLEILATLGVLGFLIYYFLYILILKNSLKNFKANNLEKKLCLAFIIVEVVFEYGFVSFYFFEMQLPLALIYFCSIFMEKKQDKSTKKIGIMIPSLSTGGAERTAVALANWLAENTKDQIYLINLGKNDQNYDIEKNVWFYSKKVCSNIPERIKEYIKLVRFMNKVQFDIIFEMLFTPLKYALIHKLFNNHLVIIGSERANPNEYDSWLKKVRCKVYPLFCDGYVFQTEKVKNMFSRVVQRKSIVIPNAISNPDIQNLDCTHIKKEKAIVAVGRLTKQKGFDFLITCFKEIHLKYPDYKLIVYGEGPMRKELEKQIQEENIEKFIKLPGNKQEVIKLVASATMFVMSSRFEGMPNALLEAMAAGMPCISTNCVAGPSEIIDNYVNGILVEVDNVDEMTTAMSQIIEDKKLRKKLATNAAKIKETHSVDQIYIRYYQYFLDIYQKNMKRE